MTIACLKHVIKEHNHGNHAPLTSIKHNALNFTPEEGFQKGEITDEQF